MPNTIQDLPWLEAKKSLALIRQTEPVLIELLFPFGKLAKRKEFCICHQKNVRGKFAHSHLSTKVKWAKL